MSMKKEPNIILNYIYNLMYQLLAVVLPLVLTPYISRTLKAEAIGAYSFCSSIATYFSLISILGLNLYGQLEISKCRNDIKSVTKSFWEIFYAKLFTSICAIVLYSIVLVLSDDNRNIYFALYLLLFSNIIDISWFYQGIEQFKKTVARNFIVKILSLVFVFAFVKNETDVIKYALILNGSTFVANITLWFPLKRYISTIVRRNVSWHLHIKRAFPYFIPTLASSIYTVLDKSMLGWIGASDYENGIYEQTHRIILAAATVVSSLSTVLLPRMSFLISQGKIEEYNRYLYKVLRVVGVVSLPISFGMIAVADPFIPIFLGDGFDKCIVLLSMFSPLVFFSGLNTVIGSQCLIAKGKQSKYNIGVIVGAISNVFLNAILIPRLLSEGAVIASVSAEVIIFGLFIIFTRRELNILTIIMSWGKALLSSIVMYLIIKLVSIYCIQMENNLIVQILIGCFVYIFMLLILKEDMLNDCIDKFRIKIMRKKDKGNL